MEPRLLKQTGSNVITVPLKPALREIVPLSARSHLFYTLGDIYCESISVLDPDPHPMGLTNPDPDSGGEVYIHIQYIYKNYESAQASFLDKGRSSHSVSNAM